MGFHLPFVTTIAMCALCMPLCAQSSSQTKEINIGEAFTGKVTGSRVRLRLNPSLDGLILKECSQGDLLVITGEEGDFYAVKPDSSWKGYVYRAYILDNTVEAHNVNLRLEPDTGAPILAKLNQGDHIVGTLCQNNNKWLVVDLPEDLRFYIAKSYVSKVGDVAFYQKSVTKRAQTVSRLEQIEHAITVELQKPFPEIQLVPLVNDLKVIAAQSQELPELAARAQALIQTAQETYLAKSPGHTSHQEIAMVTKTAELPAPQKTALPHRFASCALEEQENTLVSQAIQSGKTAEKFYQDELANSLELFGQLIPYERIVRNRPGDFMLVDATTKVPLAYLYSTKVDLGLYSGQMIKVRVTARPNHHFALPAFFVVDFLQ
jgi:hypothetical protein